MKRWLKSHRDSHRGMDSQKIRTGVLGANGQPEEKHCPCHGNFPSWKKYHPRESVGCYGSLASGFVEIKESPFSMSESQIQAVSGKLGSTLAKIS